MCRSHPHQNADFSPFKSDPFASLPASPRRPASLPTLVVSAPGDRPLPPPLSNSCIEQPSLPRETLNFDGSGGHLASSATRSHVEIDLPRLCTTSSTTTSTSFITASFSTLKPSFFRRVFSPSSNPSLSAFPFPPPPSTSERTIPGAELKQRPSSEPLLSSRASWTSASHSQKQVGRGRTSLSSLGSMSSSHSFRSLGSLGSIPESTEEGGVHVDEGGMYYDRSRETDEEDEMAADPDWPLENSSYRVEEARGVTTLLSSPAFIHARYEQQAAPLSSSISADDDTELCLSSPFTPTPASPEAAESLAVPVLILGRRNDVGEPLHGHS